MNAALDRMSEARTAAAEEAAWPSGKTGWMRFRILFYASSANGRRSREPFRKCRGARIRARARVREADSGTPMSASEAVVAMNRAASRFMTRPGPWARSGRCSIQENGHERTQHFPPAWGIRSSRARRQWRRQLEQETRGLSGLSSAPRWKIALSREAGIDAKAVVGPLAERLGWTV